MKKILEWPYLVAWILMVIMILSVNAFAVDEQVSGEWTGTITLGGNVQTGNTDKTSISFGVSGIQVLPEDRHKFEINIEHAKDGADKTEHKVSGSFQTDHFFYQNIYGYVSTRLLKDKFRNINLLTGVGPGVGIQVNKMLSLEAGLAYFSEDLVIGPDDQWVTTRGAVNYVNVLSDRVTFKDNFVINTPIDHFDDYTFRNKAELIGGLTDNWSMVLANTHEYDKSPAEDVKKKDVKTALHLQRTF